MSPYRMTKPLLLREPLSMGIFSSKMSSREALRTFQIESEMIRRGWRARVQKCERADSSCHPFAEAPDDWMVRCTYRLARALIRRGLADVLDDEIARLHIVEKGPHSIADQPFKKVLSIMFGSARATSAQLSRNRRSELGNAMAYADAHRVPSKFVNGFIKQAVLKKCGPKLAADHCEPGFKRVTAHP